MKSLVLFCLAVLVHCDKVSYKGDRVFSIYTETREHATFLEYMREQALYKLDFWSSPQNGGKVDVHIPSKYESIVLKIIEGQGMKYEVAIDDLQKLIDDADATNEEPEEGSPLSIVGTFARTSQMDAFMKSMASTYRHVTVSSIGGSFEGRTQYVAKISDGKTGKKAIWVDTGIHAREWLTQSTLIWIINEMATKYGKDTSITDMVNRFDWYFMPNVNPDGYEYSHNRDRMWRKTRSTASSSSCPGVDGNRNFDYPVFGGPSTSSNPCSDVYKGPRAFSEPEIANIKNFVMNNRRSLAMFISIHSYSQLLFTPWGYTSRRPSDYAEMDRVGKIGADAIYKVNRRRFKVGTPAQLLYVAGGASYDWAKGTAGVKYVYEYELRPAQGSGNGFIVSTSEIRPSGQEILASLTAMAKALRI